MRGVELVEQLTHRELDLEPLPDLFDDPQHRQRIRAQLGERVIHRHVIRIQPELLPRQIQHHFQRFPIPLSHTRGTVGPLPRHTIRARGIPLSRPIVGRRRRLGRGRAARRGERIVIGCLVCRQRLSLRGCCELCDGEFYGLSVFGRESEGRVFFGVLVGWFGGVCGAWWVEGDLLQRRTDTRVTTFGTHDRARRSTGVCWHYGCFGRCEGSGRSGCGVDRVVDSAERVERERDAAGVRVDLGPGDLGALLVELGEAVHRREYGVLAEALRRDPRAVRGDPATCRAEYCVRPELQEPAAPGRGQRLDRVAEQHRLAQLTDQVVAVERSTALQQFAGPARHHRHPQRPQLDLRDDLGEVGQDRIDQRTVERPVDVQPLPRHLEPIELLGKLPDDHLGTGEHERLRTVACGNLYARRLRQLADPISVCPDRHHRARHGPALHEFAALRSEPYAVCKRQRTGHAQRGVLPDAVPDYQRRLHTEGLPEPRERDLEGEESGLRGLGRPDAFRSTGRCEEEFQQTAAELLGVHLVALVQHRPEDREPRSEPRSHPATGSALSGEGESEWAGSTARDSGGLRSTECFGQLFL